jgi:hypothetical protein
MRRTTKNKTIAATAFLLFLLIIAFLVPHFLGNLADACGRHKPPHHHPRPPPLGKFIHITFTCSQTGKPIVGLPVTIGDVTIKTNAKGEVEFGSGYAPGTYTYTFEWWDGPHSVTVTIDCTKKDWYYTETLVNPEVHKTFICKDEPIEGLEVTLSGYGTQTTDADGYVEWILDYPFGNYTLEWTWNGEQKTEPVYWAKFIDGVWEKTNTLELKSGGGK